MRLLAVAFLSTVLLVPATRAAAPADCSVGPIKDVPLGGTVRGKTYTPNRVTVHVTPDGMVIDGARFDRYTLSIETDGIFNETTVSMLVKHGTKPDGRVFRVLPVDSIGAQPQAADGTPEVQGWDIQFEAANVDTSFTSETAAIRVEWGARNGNTLGGKIHFCVPHVQADIEGSFSATVD